MEELTGNGFQEKVVASKEPVVVDFWAPWCGPCKMVAPEFEKVSKELTNLKFYKVNVDDNQQVASEHGIMGIPCIVVFKDGEEVTRITGYKDAAALKSAIESAI